jgi:hypothetical protein
VNSFTANETVCTFERKRCRHSSQFKTESQHTTPSCADDACRQDKPLRSDTMPTARETFDSSIKDAHELLDHFNAINVHPPPPSAEVLKRAGLIMACTAWETYVEDRIREVVSLRLGQGDSFQNRFMLKQLETALKQFNNPNTEKTCRLFKEFAEVDVASSWQWNNYDRERASKELDALLRKRGDAVHRSKAISSGTPLPHLVKKDELEKAIRFLKSLVEATDKATIEPIAPLVHSISQEESGL